MRTRRAAGALARARAQVHVSRNIYKSHFNAIIPDCSVSYRAERSDQNSTIGGIERCGNSNDDRMNAQELS